MAITEKHNHCRHLNSYELEWKNPFRVLEKSLIKLGINQYVISDNGPVYVKGPLEMLVINITMILVILGMFLERVYKNDTDFQELSRMFR